MNTQFILAIGLMVANIIAALGTYLRFWNLHFPIGSFSFQHWLAIIGGTYLLIFVSLFAYMRRHTAVNRGTLLKVHVFGNLLAFTLISAHFAQQMGRPADFAADLGTGLATYLILAIIAVTGFLMRFWPAAKKRGSRHLIHVGLSLSLIIVLFIHALRNFGIL